MSAPPIKFMIWEFTDPNEMAHGGKALLIHNFRIVIVNSSMRSHVIQSKNIINDIK
jgi:hypothetical protein